MKKNKNHISAWFLWESLALLHCSFSGNNGCKMQSAGVRTKDADHRHLSHTNALCAVFIVMTGKHTTEQIFSPFLPLFQKYGEGEGYAFVLSLWRECEHRIRLVAERPRPAFCYSAGRSPAPTSYLLFKEGKPRNFRTERSIYF